MAGKILDERPKEKDYASFADWKKNHPDCPSKLNALMRMNIKLQGHYIEKLLPLEGEYTWGDYTEIKFWDSPMEFAKEHAQPHPLRKVQEHFVADLSEKMAPRFEQGYLIEVLGLRDKKGKDISEAMSYVKCPKSVYHVEMKRRAEDRRDSQESSNFSKRCDEHTKAMKDSGHYIGDGIPYGKTA